MQSQSHNLESLSNLKIHEQSHAENSKLLTSHLTELKMAKPSDEIEGHTITEYKPKVKRPSLYKVILVNDDFTPMDFVILILKKFFSQTEAQAQQTMMEVHSKGAGVAGVYTHEVAETKVYLVNEYARSQSYPLKSILEKEDED